MKKVIKDICISIFIAFIIFYINYLIKGNILYSDLYNQGLDFLQYYKDHFNIFSKDWIYNWNIGLGDNNFALLLYYLLSPFNLVLKLVKNFDMVTILPLFLTLKMGFMIYFASLFFEKTTSRKYRWIGSLIYISTYNIMLYGNYQIMWLDTYTFLPLVLLGIEKVIKKEGYYLYIFSLAILVITDYYLAILIIPHIAIYGILRYIHVNSNKGTLKFVRKMIFFSMISFLLSAFVLIPAMDITLSSAKQINVIPEFGRSAESLKTIFTHSFIGDISTDSNTYITLLGMIVVIPFLLLNRDIKYNLYLIHIAILFLAIYSDKINYILNFNYIPAGGLYRYNLFFNIYIAFYVYKYIEELVHRKDKKFIIGILSMSILCILIFSKTHLKTTDYKYIINLVFIIGYMIILILYKKYHKTLIIIIILLLISEVSFNYYSIDKDINVNSVDNRNKFTYVLNHISDKYGQDGRVEIRENEQHNLYIAQNIEGVSAYHSLMNSNYKNIDKVFTNTNDSDVRNYFKGRNIIAQLVGTDYYVSSHNYCPYNNAYLLEKFQDFYIFKIDNKDLKYFNKSSTFYNLKDSAIEKDALLYSNLYLNSKNDILRSDEYTKLNGIFKEYNIGNKEISITVPGDYYLKRAYNDGKRIDTLRFQVNGNEDILNDRINTFTVNDTNYDEYYIGHLKTGDKIKISGDFNKNSKLVGIKDDYIRSSIDTMNSINIKSINKTNNSFNAEFTLDKEGYVFFPIVYDKNWKVLCNGKEIKPNIVDAGFMAIELDSGEFSVEMKYVPKTFYFGVFCSTFTLLAILVLNIKRQRIKKLS